MIKQKRKQIIIVLITAIIIIAQLALNIYYFETKKTSFHEDEFFSYGYSNSYYKTYLYGSEYNVTDNYNVWMTGDDFKYYIRTNDKTAFKYDSVWYNTKTDFTPPLYYAIIHTISSVFKDKFSWYWGYGINIISFILTQIFLFKFVKKATDSYIPAIITIAFYGFTNGAQGNFLFIRPYGMYTMFCVIYAYFCAKVLSAKKISIKKHLLPIIIVAFLGALTHHYFLIIAFCLTLLVCILMIIRKKWKNMIYFGFSALSGVILSVIVFPATIPHLLGSENIYHSKSLSSSDQLHVLSDIIFTNTFGYKFPFGGIFDFDTLWLNLAFIIILPITVIICTLAFLFRKEEWFIKFKTNISNMYHNLKEKIHAERIKKTVISFFKKLKNTNLTITFGMLSSIILLVIVNKIINYGEISTDAIRYVFPVIPFLVAFFVALVYRIVIHIPPHKAKKILCCIMVLTMISVNIREILIYDPTFAASAEVDNKRINTYIKNSNCILMLRSSIYLPALCEMLENANKIRVTLDNPNVYKKDNELKEEKKLFDKDFYLIFCPETINDYELSSTKTSKNKAADKLIKYYEQQSGKKAEYVTSEVLHNGYLPLKLYHFS